MTERRSGKLNAAAQRIGCRFLHTGIVLALSIAPAFGAGGLDPKLEALLRSMSPAKEVSVIVTLQEKEDLIPFRNKDKGKSRALLIRALQARAEATQKPLRAFLEKGGARNVQTLWSINGLMATARVDVIRGLAKIPGVGDVRPDYEYGISARPVTGAPATIPAWNLKSIGATALWEQGVTGDGVVGANLDTGVDIHHADLRDRWRGGTNSWYDTSGRYKTPVDVNGHGTQAMGVIVGGNEGGIPIGIAPGARWIAVKVFDDRGRTSIGRYHLGFQWLLDPDGDPATDDAPDAVSFSWGFDKQVNECITEFHDDIRVLRAAHIAVVFAAGNGGPGASTSVSPANHRESLSCGAVNESLDVSAFSSRGPSACDGGIFPQLVAPGDGIRTADLTAGGAFRQVYAMVQGTSFAAAHVAGAMALLVSAFPKATLEEIEEALIKSAVDRGKAGPDNDYGYGLVNLQGAYTVLLRKD